MSLGKPLWVISRRVKKKERKDSSGVERQSTYIREIRNKRNYSLIFLKKSENFLKILLTDSM